MSTKKSTTTKMAQTLPGNSEVRGLVNSARRLFRKEEATKREARIAGARATFAVYEAGLIGTNREGKYGWNRAEDYAATLGTKKSNLAGLRSIGVALSVGFDPDGDDSERWGVLSQKAATADVTKVTTKSEAPDLAEIRATLDRLATANPAPTKKGADKKSTDAGKEEAAPTMPRNNSTRLDLIETLVAALDQSRLTVAEYKRVATLAEALGEMKRPVRKSTKRTA